MITQQISPSLLCVSYLATGFCDRFALAGFEVRAVSHGDLDQLTGSMASFLSDFQLVILEDVPYAADPTKTLRAIRSCSDIPIVCVTENREAADCVVALELGADDVIKLPICNRELFARLRSIMRRVSRGCNGDIDKLFAGDVEISTGQRTVVCCGESVSLTGVEFDLLVLLLRSRGRVVKRDTIASQVLGDKRPCGNRSIDVHISVLRKKLGFTPNGNERIKTVRGSGYLYAWPND